MIKKKLLLFTVILGLNALMFLNACVDEEEDPNACSGLYETEQECNDAISGVDNCVCEFEGGNWFAKGN